MAGMEELFGSDYSNDGRSPSGSSPGSAQLEDENEQFNGQNHNFPSEREAVEQSDASDAEASGSNDEARNEYNIGQSVRSDDERSEHSVAASDRSNHSVAGSDRSDQSVAGSDRSNRSAAASDRSNRFVPQSERTNLSPEQHYEASEDENRMDEVDHSDREQSDDSEAEVERSGSEGHHSNVEADQSDSEGHQSDAEAEGSDSEARHSDVEADRSGSEVHHSDVEADRSDSEGHQSEAEAEAERSGSEGHQSDVEAERSFSDQQSDAEVERAGSEGQQSDAEIERSGSEGQQSDAEVERSGSEGQPSDVEIERSGSEGHQSDVEVERSDSERHQSDAEGERSGSEGHQSEAEGYGNDGDQSEVERSDEGDRKFESQHSDDEASYHSDAMEDGNQNMNERSASEKGSGDEYNRVDQEMKSDSEDDIPTKKRKRIVSSDEGSAKGSDDESMGKRPRHSESMDLSENENEQKATEQDLFGGDVGDISSDEDGESKIRHGEKEESQKPTFGDEEQEQEEPVPETRIEVEIPRITTNLGKEIHFIKLPNFLSVDTRPYDPQWYEDEIDEDEVLDEEGRARLKLKVENTVRWRYTYDELGNPHKESNARIIRWSDGSLSLHLGSEIFDIHRQLLMQGDHNHLFIRQGTGLQGQAVFRTKLTFRPHSTDSFTHRKMTLSLADRNQKTQKIRVLPNVGKDPEAHRTEMIKKEEDRLKASIRRENKQRRIREKAHGRGLTSSYLESDRYDEEDDGAISLSAIKNKYKKGGSALKERRSIYSSDEESDDEKAKRLEQAKSIDDDDDDSDLDYFEKKKAATEGKKKMATIEESDEES